MTDLKSVALSRHNSYITSGTLASLSSATKLSPSRPLVLPLSKFLKKM